MSTCTLAGPDRPSASRLLIHAPAEDARQGRGVEALVQRMRARVLDGPRGERPPIGLEIRDLEGHRVLAIEDAGPLIDVALPPGTYQVSMEHAGIRRSYTVALAAGASFDLHLRLPRDRR